MTKKKQPVLAIGLTLVGVFVLMICQVYSPRPGIPVKVPEVQNELPVETVEIPMNHNKYGDYLVGLWAQRNQDYDRTAVAFEQALTDDPENQNMKITVYLMKAIRGDIEAALPLARELMGLKKAELMTDYLLIAEAFKGNQYEQAADLLANKVAYGPDGVLKPALQAWIFVGQGNREKAEESLSALNRPDSDALYYFYRGLIALAFEDDEGAAEAFRNMSRLSEKGYPSLVVLPLLRDFYTKHGQWQPGQADHDRIQAFLERSPSVKDVMGVVVLPEKVTPDLGAAVAFYDISVALSTLKLEETCLILNELSLYLYPSAVIPKIWGGELLESAQNYRAANRIYDRINDQPTVVLMKKAVNLTAVEAYREALPVLENLRQKAPQEAAVHMMLGDVYTQLEMREQAVAAYTKAAALFQPQDKKRAADALLALGAVYDNMKQHDQAEKTLLKAIQLEPNNPLLLNYLGYIWLDKKKNVDQAFDMVQKAAELAPEDPNIMDSLALGYYLKEDYPKALELSEKAIDQISYSSVAYAHLGDIYAALDRKREARYQYRKALDLTKDITPELKKELEQKLSRR